jgi:hypothetical protein
MAAIVYKDLKVTRSELYAMVWKQPITKIAAHFGHSDTAIANACKSNRIPRPPHGYWTMKRSGKTLRRPHLPAGENVTLTYRVFERDGKRVSHAEWLAEQYQPYYSDPVDREARQVEHEKRVGWQRSIDALVKEWGRARYIREFVEACKASVVLRGDGIIDAVEFAEWSTWALKHADEIDPTISLKLPGAESART